MPFSRPEKTRRGAGKDVTELCDINQLGLDFAQAASYSVPLRKEIELMNQELLEVLEKKIGDVVEKYSALKEENARLHEEIERLSNDREGFKHRVDAILGRLDGI
ncbi:MAG: cell division protein ZapB [Desulfuromonadaceae bacterium]|nr:cell division protein ZapB [Desulfuromonadaceae bacterium]